MGLLTTAATLGFSKLRIDPHLGCNFYVEIDGLIAGQFRDVQGLWGTVKVHEFTEGGNNGYTHKLPSEMQYGNLTLSKGVTELTTMWDWFAAVAEGYTIRRSMTVALLDHERYPVMWWNVRGALPVKWTGPTFNAASGEVGVESLELIHNGISKPFLSDLVSGIRLGVAIGRQL